ncbi:N-acetylglucosamine-6-phosphate deacetylase [Caldibacillus thermoamylovorans]|uniref:N-acetylglucosamine-6-phosphate deacetylase n=1 Tax=Caldibacillus thermoamylovorans TaxID=35841 RepID=A0A0D0FZC1_9BACI|nr:N-acetylglucosamine-6-phosphate deacetylase [Caldibacillus thermoamylovorans]AWI13646.1 N-acetylglucosamine-6-phosphate deacetylase [Caldibacillus thermoamylovorans]KIO69190.1 N-acetylglucosamine-6-phosphate deacetylase [Caldibacillus thermoamylovorans]KIO71215.1 N-acetylglucosamine-6-phosphate deacetylase [Caldibacillus thermoamylovorans]KIO74074.1 N-acetylglucosamine-6-phosphate deacetylase [Caldibacillus thermoamylovorans]MDL0420880.1 N-acetylglucosamine-6-phosphate deacetylase [Caldibac
MQYILTGTVCIGEELREDQYVLIEGEKIKEVGPVSNMPTSFSGEVLSYPKTMTIVPGFIDVHIHGAGGADAMDATPDALNKIAQHLVKEGTTAFLATTMTQSKQAIEAALKNAGEFIHSTENRTGQAEIIGIHLEGPFIHPKRKGAQPEEFILLPSSSQFDEWQELAQNTIRIVTLAPDQENGIALVKHLAEHGVIASIGHSDANFQDVVAAVEAGASHVTHLFNGMRGLHHREPGTAGGALLLKELTVELIADGIHVHPKMIDLVFRLKDLDHAVLITDSMRAKWLPDGESELGGQKVFVSDGKATLEDGTLAGSILKLNQGVKHVMKFANLTLPEVVKLVTMNPAKELGLHHRKGSIEAGKDADLVVLNEKYDPILTICRGGIAFKGE